MGRIARPTTRARVNTDDELAARETDRRTAGGASAAAGRIVARHAWTWSGNLAANTDLTIPGWTRARDDGIASLDSTGIILNAPGIWTLVLALYSDAGAAGHMLTVLRPASGQAPLDGSDAFRQSGYRGSGFGNAGRVDHLITWTGPISDTEAVDPWSVILRNSAGGAVTTAIGIRFQANYLGTATWADVGTYEADPTA